RREFQIVNLDALNRLEGVTKITPELLYEKKLIRKRNLPVKILGDGQLSKALEVSAHAFSKSAAEKIESIGGKTILL
ncbi:MAG TPA: 50S ribosomal protein L15, partial [Bacteroidetes bacterium]|nr:50S ribosomal protein L15 [Bacteroidota bacterium]